MNRSTELREPTRLTDEHPEPGSSEARLQALISVQPSPEPLSATQLAQVRRAVHHRTAAPQANWNIVAWAAAGAIVIATTSMGWAQNGSLGARLRDSGRQFIAQAFGQRQAAPPAEPTPTVVPIAPTPTVAAPILAPPVIAAPPAIAPTPRPSVARVVRTEEPKPTPLPINDAPPAPIVVAPVEAPPTSLALEAQSLGEIAVLLHTPGGAASALEKIKEHEARFPGGPLAAEAVHAELDADVLLDRRPDALALIAQLDHSGESQPDELRVLHGELLAKGGDCNSALTQWGTDLPMASPLAERSLYGRATCLASLGRTGDSRAAMTDYLTRFPKGRFVAVVRAALNPTR